MSFLSDASTFLLLPGQEVSDSAALSDLAGNENLGVQAISSPLSKQAGPNANLLSRNVDGLGGKAFASVAAVSQATAFQASCTVEAVLKPYNYANAATSRSIYMHGQGIDEYFWLVFDQTGQLKVLFNIAGATTTVLSGLTMTENAWMYVAARKTVTSGSGTSRLSTWDFWVLPLTGNWNATPGSTTAGVANPNPTGGSGPYNSVGCRWFGSLNTGGSFYFAGLKASNVARTAAELQANFARFQGTVVSTSASASPFVGTPTTMGVSSTVDYGQDISVFPDIDDTLLPKSGTAQLLDSIARRLVTPKGLLWDHPDYGVDLRQYLNGPVTSPMLYAIKQAVETEVLADERIRSASATVSYSDSTKRIKVQLQLVGADGPFTLTLSVTSVSVELVSES